MVFALGSAFLGVDRRFNLGDAFSERTDNDRNDKKRRHRSRPLWWYKKSFEFLTQAETLAIKIGDDNLISSSKGGMGMLFLSLKDLPRSKKYFEEALEIQKNIRNPFQLSLIVYGLACTHDYLGEREEACVLLKEALTIFETIESPKANDVRQWIAENCGV